MFIIDAPCDDSSYFIQPSLKESDVDKAIPLLQQLAVGDPILKTAEVNDLLSLSFVNLNILNLVCDLLQPLEKSYSEMMA